MNRILMAVGMALTLAACGGEDVADTARPLGAVEVVASSAQMASAEVTYAGQAVALQEVPITSRTTGTIEQVAVQVGDQVATGARIARVDDRDVQARIASAAASVRLAEVTFTRVDNLARDGAASLHELDQARAAMESTRAALQEAEAQATWADIRAPFAGTVTARMSDPGDMASPGHPIVQLSGAGVKIVAEIPSERAGSIRVGDPVRVDTDAGATAGSVARVVPALDAASRRFRVEIAPESPKELLPGSFVRLGFPESTGATTLWIPVDALVRNGQMTGVFTVMNDTLRLRWIRVGRITDDRVEVLAAPPGDLTVVRNPDRGFRDGQPVSRVTHQPFEPAGG